MEVQDEHLAAAIAEAWDVDVGWLQGRVWRLENIEPEGNPVRSYRVRFTAPSDETRVALHLDSGSSRRFDPSEVAASSENSWLFGPELHRMVIAREAADALHMRTWFLQRYEDPRNSLPYSDNSGFEWIRGGPHSPLNVLVSNFLTTYSLDQISRVAADLVAETSILDWTTKVIENSDHVSKTISGFIDIEDVYGFEDLYEVNDSQVDQAARLSETLPIAEELVVLDDGRFDVSFRPVARPSLYRAIISQVADAVEDAIENPSNGLRSASSAVQKLRRTLDRYANDPQRVEMDFTAVHHTLTMQIVHGDLPPSDQIQALISALQEGAQSIRATDQQIADNRLLLQSQSMRELTPEAVRVIIEAVPALEAATNGELQLQMREDAHLLTQPITPIISGNQSADLMQSRRDATVRVVGRTARLVLEIRKIPDWIHKIHSSASMKAASILGGLYGLVKFFASIFLLF